MINVNTKIHDKYSIEFKVGFTGMEPKRANDFSVNAWIFTPYSLDINNATYGKEQFYRDVKSNVRLITPKFTLEELSSPQSKALQQVQCACQRFQDNASDEAKSECEFLFRLFAAIFKSSLRDETKALLQSSSDETLYANGSALLNHVQTILAQFRKNSCDVRAYAHADEYMSHLADVNFMKVIRNLDNRSEDRLRSLRAQFADAALQERAYKAAHGYSHIDLQDASASSELVYRHSLLKKNIESVLYLRVDTAPDSDAAQQISFGAAAGIAMILSTLIALPFQKYLGNYPILIFIILVIAYIFKDRLKDYVRARFAHRMKSKYFDNKTIISFRDRRIGWIKEGMDFIGDSKTPLEVLSIRNRSELESDNSMLCERAILYRKQVHIEGNHLQDHYQYDFTGINDILRLHIQLFTQKMDDPTLQIDTIRQDGSLTSIEALRTYPIHIVLQFSHGGQTEYRGFRITASRKGINDITQL